MNDLKINQLKFGKHGFILNKRKKKIVRIIPNEIQSITIERMEYSGNGNVSFLSESENNLSKIESVYSIVINKKNELPIDTLADYNKLSEAEKELSKIFKYIDHI